MRRLQTFARSLRIKRLDTEAAIPRLRRRTDPGEPLWWWAPKTGDATPNTGNRSLDRPRIVASRDCCHERKDNRLLESVFVFYPRYVREIADKARGYWSASKGTKNPQGSPGRAGSVDL